MQSVSSFITTTLPNYLSNLPIPDTFSGWFELSGKDWESLLPAIAGVVGISYLIYKWLSGSDKGPGGHGGRVWTTKDGKTMGIWLCAI